MEVDSTKLSFADSAVIRGAVIDSICPEPDYWGVIVNQNRLLVGCILRYIGFIHFPVELEGDTLFKVVLDVNPDVIPPDSTLLDIKDIEYPIPGIWYHGIDGVFYIHQEGCEGPSGYSQPHQFELDQNYPNPFNATTTLNYALPQVIGERFKVKGGPNTSHLIPVTLRVYNILGEEVVTLVDSRQGAGRYQVIWHGKDKGGRDVSSGIYFCQLRVGRFSQTRKMLLLR